MQIIREDAHLAAAGDFDSQAIRQRILDRSIPVTESGCWLWEGWVHPSGYCRTSINNVTKLAHRVSFEAFRGPIAKGLLVCHRCDVRTCVNPNHLFLGTSNDNNQDMFVKGRHKPARGERAGGAKLTALDVESIRRLLGTKSQREIAIQFGVRQPVISDISTGKSWRQEG